MMKSRIFLLTMMRSINSSKRMEEIQVRLSNDEKMNLLKGAI